MLLLLRDAQAMILLVAAAAGFVALGLAVPVMVVAWVPVCIVIVRFHLRRLDERAALSGEAGDEPGEGMPR
jgi:hypothetical protein